MATKHTQAASPRKAKDPTPTGDGFLKPRKPPSGPLSTPHHEAERGGPEWGGEEEAHLDDAQERAKMREAAREAKWDEIVAEDEAKREKKNEEDDYEDYDDDDDDDDDDHPSSAVQKVTPSAPAITTDADRMNDYIERLKARRTGAIHRGLVGASTGLPRLDAATGGLQQITLLAGDTGSGKTSLAAHIAVAALRQDPKLVVVYYAMDDMTADDLFDQMVCCEAGVDHTKLVGRELSEEERGNVNAATASLRQDVQQRMVTLDHFPNKYGRGVSGEDIFDFCHRFMRQVGAERVLVVLDMLNDLPHPRASGDWTEDYLPAVRRIEGDPDRWRLEQVVDLRKRSEGVCPGGWPVLALCKLRKSEPRRREPGIEDILGSVDLAYKAKRVFFLVPDPKANPSEPVVAVTLAIKKGRHADMVRLPLRFHHTQFRLEELKGSTQEDIKAGKKGSSAVSKKQAKPSSSVDPLAGMDS